MKYGNLSTKNGLIFLDGKMISLSKADWIASAKGFIYAENLVKALEEEPPLTWQEAEFLANANRLGLKGASVIFCLARDIRENHPAQASFDANLKEFNLSGEGSIKAAVRERIIEFLKDDWKIEVNYSDGGEL